MWYRLAQALNIVGPAAPINPPEMAGQVADGSTLESPSATPSPPAYQPPLHEKCHCQIDSLLDGSYRWRCNNDNPCPQCAMARDMVNSVQPAAFGITSPRKVMDF